MPRLHQRNPRGPCIAGDFQQRPKLRRLPQQLAQNRQNRRSPIIPQPHRRRLRQTPPSRIDNRPTHSKRQPSRRSNRPGDMRFHIDSQRPRRPIQRALLLLPTQRRGHPSNLSPHRPRLQRCPCKGRKHPRGPFGIRIDNPKRPRHLTGDNHRPRFQLRRKPTGSPKTHDPGASPRQRFAQRPLEQIRPRSEHRLNPWPPSDTRFKRHPCHRDNGQTRIIGAKARARIRARPQRHIPAVTRDAPSRIMFLYRASAHSGKNFLYP
jgi:hypothetical protein